MRHSSFFIFLFSGLLTVGLSFGLIALAGSLTPSASPASTMNSLEDIYNAVAGSFNSSSITANQSGSLLQLLRYINNNLGFASSSTNIYSLNSGNVGIGTSTPTAKLHVVGTLTVTATTTFNAVSYGWPSADGSANQLLTTSGSGTLTWTTAGSGSSAPVSLSQLIAATTSNTLSNATATQTHNWTLSTAGGTGMRFSETGTSTATSTTLVLIDTLTNSNASPLHVKANANTALLIATSGNVGIGTTTPSSLFVVAGNTTITGNATTTTLNVTATTTFNTVRYGWPSADGSSGQVLSTNGSGILSWAANGGSGPPPVSLSQLLAATTSNTLANATATQTWNWTLSTAGGTGMRFSETATSTATSTILVLIDSLTNSNAMPFVVRANATTALQVSTSGNIAIGVNSTIYKGNNLYIHNSGTDNFFAGVGAGNLTTSGTGFNVGVGPSALSALTTGDKNTAVGRAALSSNTTGVSNTAVGNTAFSLNTTGGNNTAVGDSALLNNTEGNSNIAVGSAALSSNTTGDDNIAVGISALLNNTEGNNSIAVGRSALGLNTTGGNNIALGYQAGDNITTGSTNLIIGYNVDAPSATASNQLNIGNLIFSQGIDGTGTTLSTGSIGINTTSPSQKLHVFGSFLVSTSTLNPLIVTNTGSVGINTTTPTGYLHIANGTTSILFATSTNRVGIGTSTPTWSLTVAGGGICIQSASACPAEVAGGLRVDTAGSVGGDDSGDVFDLAERYPATEAIAASEIVALDASTDTPAVRVARQHDVLIGVMSTKPAIAISGSDLILAPHREATSSNPLIALAGRVSVRVSGERGPIKPGDKITVGNVPGIGVKANPNDQAIGFALRGFNGSSAADRRTILVYVKLGWPQLNASAGSLPGQWLIDDQGRLKTTVDVDLDNHALLNVQSINSKNGKWSISENGRIVGEELEVKRATIREQLRLIDKDTGQEYCAEVRSGQLSVVPCDPSAGSGQGGGGNSGGGGEGGTP